MDHVKYYLTRFDFTASLLQAIISEPPPYALSDLSDMSPLTTPPSSPSPSTSSLPEQTPWPEPLHSTTSPSEYTDHAEHTQSANIDKGESGPQDDGPGPAMSRRERIKARQHARNRQWRKKQRTQKAEAMDSFHIPREGPRAKYVATAEPIECSTETAGCKVTAGGYTALNHGSGSKKAWRLGEMTGDGSKCKFRLIKWDGRYVKYARLSPEQVQCIASSTTQAILDKSRRIIGILAGHPQTEDWPSVHAQAAEAMEAQQSKIHLPKKSRRHRRGAFPAIAGGISFGGGQRRPSHLHNEPANASALEWLSSLQPFKRIAGFASCRCPHP